MPDIIFARPRHNYDSYADLYTLITASGFPLIYFDEVDPDSDNLYILTLLNGENQHGWDAPKAEIVLWDLEWRVDSPPRIPGVSRVWASDRWYAGKIGAEYITLGSHRALANGSHVQPVAQYDVAAMMYTGPYRRNHIMHQLSERGITIAMAAWGDLRHQRLKQSRAMLHIHQHPGVSTIAPLRWALAAAYGLPVVSEIVTNAHPFYSTTIWASYENIKCNPLELLCSDRRLQRCGAALQQQLCDDLSFRQCVEQIA